MKNDLSTETISDNIVTQGELLELASVVSHLQEENQMLWDRVHSTDQAMVDANQNLEATRQNCAGQGVETQAQLHQAETKLAEFKSAKVQAEQSFEHAVHKLEQEQAAHRKTQDELQHVRQLASEEDEATLKEHRRRLTEELLDVESKLVSALEERENVKRLLEGDTSVQVDKEYWACAMAMLLERAQLHENQTVLSTQCQEAQLQNRALASQVVELENQVMQSHTALNAWNALNAS
eukprot:TRINITY_DN4674_c0_g1_i1.p1 TRINITY_DN4674_c0_g1~~TRINITY_DN4674_c0_g1_i1.p1  ORF type:complete len:237 (+),score=65.77 TRINITY_DN4674_c0_g1_i1:224-934(+)